MEIEINTKLTNKEIEEALLGDLNKLWEVISSLEGNKELDKEIEKIKWGINEKFDIRSIIEEEYEKKVAYGEVWIERKLHVDITKFRDEIDKRKIMMKNILRELYDESFDSQEEEEIEGYKQ